MTTTSAPRHRPAAAGLHPACLDDEALPSWAGPFGVEALLTDWLRAPVHGEVLAYAPGRRATLRLRSQHGTCVLKIVSAEDWDQLRAATRLATAVGPPGPCAPDPLALSPQHRAVLLTYLRGVPLDQLAPEELTSALRQLPDALAQVHRLTDFGLPGWDSSAVLHEIETAAAALGDSHPPLLAGVGSVTAAVAAELARWTGPGRPCHGDLNLHNVLWQRRAGALAVIDWDRAVLGPAELDLAGLVALLPDRAAGLVQGYEQATGAAVDRPLLHALLAAHRVLRTLRRISRGAMSAREGVAVLDDLAGPLPELPHQAAPVRLS